MTGSSGSQTVTGMSMVDYRNKLFRYYSESRFVEALEVAKEAATEFPDYEAKTTFWIACLENRLGNHEEAVQALQRAVKSGIWWPDQFLRDSDLESIRDRPEFRAIEAECVRLRREQSPLSEPELMVRTPPDYSKKNNWPSLMMFHQRYGERPELSAEPWSPILLSGVVLAAPWSSQVYCSDGRCWDNLQSAEEDVRWAASELRDKYRVNWEKFVFGGFSQGGGLSIYSALKRLAPNRGFVAVASSDWVVPEKPAIDRRQPSETFSSFIKASDCTGLRGVIIIGDQDAFYPKVEQLYEMMLDRGLNGKLLIEKGVGHEYPENFGNKLKIALDFVLGS